MNRTPPASDHLWRLANAVCNQTATEAELHELERTLTADREACVQVAELFNLEAELQWTTAAHRGGRQARAAELTAPAQPAAAPLLPAVWRATTRYFSHPVRFSFLVATISLASFLLTTVQLPVQRPWAASENAPAATPRSIARWSEKSICEWAGGAAPSNSTLRAGESLELRHGLVELRFESGARVVLEGPSTFTLQSALLAELPAGKLTALVPDRAAGFTIATPHATIVDLGTEFGITVGPEGTTEIHVLTGAVSAQLTGNLALAMSPMHIARGSGLRIARDADSPKPLVQTIASDRRPFARALASAGAIDANVAVTIEAGDGTPAFRFPTLPSPSPNDAADASRGTAKIRARDLWDSSLPAEALLDGQGDNGGHVRFEPGKPGAFLLDLGRVTRVREVVSYSWHIDGPPTGAPQIFQLYGSAAEAPPETEGDPQRHGWTPLAAINTEAKLGAAPFCASQQAVSIAGKDGVLGEFRYFLWRVAPLSQNTTYFDEIDVYEQTID